MVARLVGVIDKPSLEFISAYKMGLIDALLQSHPRMPISEISMRTGVDRRQVSQYLNEKQIKEREKRNKLAMILGELDRLKKQRFNSGWIPRRGRLSFDQICINYANGDFSPGGILKELVRLGNVIDHGDQIELVHSYPSIREDAVEFLELITWNIDQLTQTALHNRNTKEKQNRCFQRVIYSTQIPFENKTKANAEIKAVLLSAYQEIHCVLEKYEAPVSVGTFEPIGVSLFQFAPLPAQTDSRHWGDET